MFKKYIYFKISVCDRFVKSAILNFSNNQINNIEYINAYISSHTTVCLHRILITHSRQIHNVFK